MHASFCKSVVMRRTDISDLVIKGIFITEPKESDLVLCHNKLPSHFIINVQFFYDNFLQSVLCCTLINILTINLILPVLFPFP